MILKRGFKLSTMEFCVKGSARCAAIHLLEVETASPASHLLLRCGPVSVVEDAKVVVYALDEEELVPEGDEAISFLLRIRHDLCAEFEQDLAAWCASREIEYVYESGEPDDGISRLVSALSEAQLSAAAFRAPSNEPVVCVAGDDTGSICDRLRAEFSGFEEFLDVETKYYRKRVRLAEVPSGAEAENAEMIQAVVLVVDSTSQADDLWRRLDVDCGTRIVVSRRPNAVSIDWILENHFEVVDANSEDPHDGMPRLADALKCTLWTDEAPVEQNDARNLDDVETGEEDNLDDLFALAAKLRDQTSGDDQKRRQDAADLALRLAATLGLDDDSSSEED